MKNVDKIFFGSQSRSIDEPLDPPEHPRVDTLFIVLHDDGEKEDRHRA